MKFFKMREIKFRAWDYSKKIFLPTKTYAVLSVTEFGATGIMLTDFEEYREGEYFYPHSQVINQYTGLKDKNGKEIYEGDVVKSFHNNECSVIRFGEYKHIVGFEEEDIYNCIGFYFGKDIIPFAKDIYGQTNKYEVIGNIYENPELLNNN